MTRSTRWLILLLGSTLLFGVLCFAGGLLLGLYFGRADSPIGSVAVAPAAVPSIAATAPAVTLPTAPTVALPSPPAAPATPALPLTPGGVQVTTPSATVQVGAPQPAASPAVTPPATASAQAVPALAPAPPVAAAGSAAPSGTAPASPAGSAPGQPLDAFPVRPVADLRVGVPPSEEPPSGLRGPLVSDAAAAAAAGPATAPANGAAPAATPPTQAQLRRPPTPEPPPKRAFGVRAGAYLDPGAAQRRAEALKLQGYQPVILSSGQPEERLTWYSVVLGPQKDLATTRREAEQFERDQNQRPEIVSWSLAPPEDAAVAGTMPGAPPPKKP